MRITILDEELPFPIDSGKRIRTMNLVTRLAKMHAIRYVCYPYHDAKQTQQAEAFYRDHGVEVAFLDDNLPLKQGVSFYARLGGNLLSRFPYSVQSHCRKSLRQEVLRQDRNDQVDLWHCEWTPYAAACLRHAKRPWVVMAHNIESLIWQRYYENETNLVKKYYIGIQWKKFERFERRTFSETSRLITVSQSDAQLAESQFGAKGVSVVDNGVDIGYFKPTDTTRRPEKILFLGSLDWRPNLDAAVQLLDTIFPKIRATVPNAVLSLVGRRPPEWLVRRVKETPGVELHADVPDVRPHLAECGAMIVPLRIGGGSRLKILEALSAGCPVISTSIGAEGLHIRPGIHYLRADSNDELASATVHAIRSPESMQQLAQAGHEQVVQQYHWDILAEKLDTIWQETCQQSQIT